MVIDRLRGSGGVSWAATCWAPPITYHVPSQIGAAVAPPTGGGGIGLIAGVATGAADVTAGAARRRAPWGKRRRKPPLAGHGAPNRQKKPPSSRAIGSLAEAPSVPWATSRCLPACREHPSALSIVPSGGGLGAGSPGRNANDTRPDMRVRAGGRDDGALVNPRASVSSVGTCSRASSLNQRPVCRVELSVRFGRSEWHAPAPRHPRIWKIRGSGTPGRGTRGGGGGERDITDAIATAVITSSRLR